MPEQKDLTRLSRFLSLVLRHQPETIGVQLDEQGWVATRKLLEQLNRHGHSVTETLLQEIVAANSKQRFAFNEDGTRIRANQGHSVAVTLQLPQQTPPAILYHGTGKQAVASIQATGLVRGSRHQVHLSADPVTAVSVGRRHGQPVVFEVAAARMHADGFAFFLSANGVWLTDEVPPSYLLLQTS